MNFRRLSAMAALTALLLGTTAMPALAQNKEHESEKSRGYKVSDKFEDMDDYEWGLGEVTKMMLKGVFQGRGESIFAPGAKLTHQEAAVAVVRLMEKEAEGKELTAAEVDSLLSGIGDAGKIAVWARPSVAMLVKVGAISKDAPFAPLEDATRLDIAVLLVGALGYKAEAEAKMTEKLEFKDAHLIPAELVGYVKTAIDHELITGYEDRTFRPHQAVKRVEMAVMMGRADRLNDREKEDEIKGTVKLVDAAKGSLMVWVGDRARSLTLAEDASIFINSVEKELSDLVAGMAVEIKLNREGKVVYIEAKTVAPKPDPRVGGTITSLIPATPNALALITIGSVVYPISPRAVITLNGKPATFADLKVGDTAKTASTLGLIIKLEATRPVKIETISGTVSALVAATAATPAKITVTFPSLTTPAATAEYTLAASAVIKLNGQVAAFADLKVGDSVKMLVTDNLVEKVEVTRAYKVYEGSIISLSAPAAGQSVPAGTVGLVGLIYTSNGSTIMQTYPVTAETQILVSGQAAQYANLQLGDPIRATFEADLLVKLEVKR